MKQTIVLSLAFCFAVNCLPAQPAQRKAIMGMQGKPSAKGIVIDSIFPNGSFAALGLAKTDIVQSVNGKPTLTLESYNAIASQIRTGDNIEVKYLRADKAATASAKAIMRPMETSAFADISYDWVPFRNGFLRTITRKPKGKENVPAILLIPGYGCGSIENYASSYNGKLLYEWVKNGYAVVTIEKSGMGDSYGCEPCAEADLNSEIESFDAGYRYMENLPYIDKKNLFVWGHSMGGVVAPEVAKRHHPQGVMVYACTFRPWSEFLLEMHRVQKPLLEGLNYQQTEEFVRKIQKIYYEFFVLKKTPAQLYTIPEYKDLVESDMNYAAGSNNMWGRHWRYWQELDSLNMAETWKLVDCPVLILHGTADYEQCSLVEPMLIKETVNITHPGNATQVTIPGIDHFMMNSKDWKEAAANFKAQQYAKGNFNYKIAEETVKWLRTVSGLQ